MLLVIPAVDVQSRPVIILTHVEKKQPETETITPRHDQ